MGHTATFILSGNHLDNHRNTLWLRSPEFHLDGSGDLTFQLLAGTGAGVAPTTESSVPFAAGDIDTTGWIGVCLRDVTTGAFVLSGNRSSRDFNNWQQLTFTAAQLAKLNQTHAYTLDLLVTGKGLWSWVGLDNVAIPGITLTSSKVRKETGAKASAGAQTLKDEVKVETVASQPAWVMGNDEVELAVTQLGAHMAPVKFYRASSTPVQPYYISPWHAEKLEDIPVPVLKVIRGDFFCMPFGVNGASANGETHPPHGEPAGGGWNLVGHGKTGSVTFLEISFKPQILPGTITKWISLVDGQNVIYTREIMSGFKGSMPLGHHATLAVPEKEGSLRVATSPFAFGMTCPVLFSDPRNREYQSFAIGKEFGDLRRVPLLWKAMKRNIR